MVRLSSQAGGRLATWTRLLVFSDEVAGSTLPDVTLLAVSETVSAGLIGAGAALVGALVGGAASFGGTWWERRSERESNRADTIRSIVADFIDVYGGAPVRLSFAGTSDDFARQVIELRTNLWTPRAQLRMHAGTESIDGVMHRIYVELGSLDGKYPIDMEQRSRLIVLIEELADVTAHVVSAR